MSEPAFRRILLKLSGEALMGSQGFGVDPAVAARIASEVSEVREMGVQVAIVVGGGNFIRGVAAAQFGIDIRSADFWRSSLDIVREDIARFEELAK